MKNYVYSNTDQYIRIKKGANVKLNNSLREILNGLSFAMDPF